MNKIQGDNTVHLHELKVCPVIMTVPRRHVSNRGNVTS
jgi:hypothetical protein